MSATRWLLCEEPLLNARGTEMSPCTCPQGTLGWVWKTLQTHEHNERVDKALYMIHATEFCGGPLLLGSVWEGFKLK